MYTKSIKAITDFAIAVSCVGFVVLMLATSADVILRWLWGKPISGVTELCQTCMMLSCASFGSAVLIDAHTKVSALTDKMPIKIRRVLNASTLLLTVVWCFLMTWQGLERMLYTRKMNVIYTTIGIKEWWIVAIFALSFCISGLAVIVLIRQEWKRDTELIANSAKCPGQAQKDSGEVKDG